MSAPRFAVLVSGRGSNLIAIDNARALLGAAACGVISSRASAPALALAEARGLNTAVVSAPSPQREHALTSTLEGWGVEWIVLAGWMRILTDDFVARYAGRIVNIHPSLLPSFPGLHPQRQAIEAGVRISGATVHLVTPGAVDGGPILAQGAVDVLPGDTPETLADRILHLEHSLYPTTLDRLFRGEFNEEVRRAQETRVTPLTS